MKLTESNRILILDKEEQRTLSLHRVWESNLEAEEGRDYTKDADIKNALSNILLPESLGAPVVVR